ncbi:MAG: DUF4114 domain-containing protein [Bacteroidaceae bacterium]|nr:DUF4114 domain-containing protein [Bacteroidaceae bacterium]
MKKCFYMAAALFGLVSFASCTSDENVNNGGTPDEKKVKEVVTSIKATFGNSAQVLTVGQSNDQSLTAVLPRGIVNKYSRAADDNKVTEFTWYGKTADTLQAGTASKLTNEVFMKDFPNNQDNLKTPHPDLEDLSFDFLYVSNGEPVEVWPLYSHAGYVDDIGIYYYDQDGNMHEEDTFWSMADDGWLAKGIKTTYQKNYEGKYAYCRYAKEDVDTYNGTGYGYKFQLPKGWKWGFYIKNDQNGKKYSQSTLHAKDSKGNLQKQVVTYRYGEYNLIGFEDIFYSGADKDYNDIALLVSPKQVVTPTGQVTVRWITEDGRELCPNEYSGEMASGALYTGYAKEFKGWELVDPTHTEETKTINEYDTDNVITFVYKEKPIPTQYTVNYICKDGCTLLGTETFGGFVNDEIYATEKMKQFEDHGFTVYDKERITLVEDASQNVINLYYEHTKTSYVVKYLDEETGEELTDPFVGNKSDIGETVNVNEINIQGYTCTNPGQQTKVLVKDPNSNVFIYYYKKNSVPIVPIDPLSGPDIVIVLDALDKDLVCESDDFGIKYNQHEIEYAYADHSASSLVDLKLEQGKPIAITIPDINAWTNDSKTYWYDLGNGIERACFDLRLYNCRDAQGNTIPAETLAQMLNLNYIKKPAGYSVQVDCVAGTDQYGTSGVHISVIVDRIKQ